MVEKVTIQTERPAAAKWNGKTGEMVRTVEAGEPAYNDKLSQDQVVVAIDGPAPGQPREEIYFFADEVVGYEPKDGEPRPPGTPYPYDQGTAGQGGAQGHPGQPFNPDPSPRGHDDPYPSRTPGQIGQEPFSPQPRPPGAYQNPARTPGQGETYQNPAPTPQPNPQPQPPLNPAPGQPLQPGVYNPPTPVKPQG